MRLMCSECHHFYERMNESDIGTRCGKLVCNGYLFVPEPPKPKMVGDPEVDLFASSGYRQIVLYRAAMDAKRKERKGLWFYAV